MRVNIYSEELTEEIKVVSATTFDGKKYLGLRFFLESTYKLHSTLDDDDRSAVTFWFESIKGAELFLEKALSVLESI